MRVAVCSFQFEGNTFSIMINGEEDFARRGLIFGEGMVAAVEGKDVAIAGAIEVLKAHGLDIVPVLMANGGSGGRVEGGFYRRTKSRILEGIRHAGKLDGVFLALHGAMIAEGEDDPEGDILAAVRELVGPVIPIAASLDLHAHVTPRMAAAANILVGYKTYPHADAFTTGQRAAELLGRTVAGCIRPITRLCRLNALISVPCGITIEGMPMSEVGRLARAAERSGRVLSASYFPVQPWLDIPGHGITGLAVSDGDPSAADEVAREIVMAMWDRRDRLSIDCYPPDEAVRRAIAHPLPRAFILDAPDSPGGGGTGDAPAILDAFMRLATHLCSAVSVVDAAAAAAAHKAGVGARISVELGGTIDGRFYAPVKCDAVVRNLTDGSFTYAGGPAKGLTTTMGPTAVLTVGELQILVPSFYTYEFGAEQYESAGIDIRACRLVAFKNPTNFRTLLDGQTAWFMVSGPGPTPADLTSLPWKAKQRPFWPCDDVAQPVFLDN